MSHPLFHSRAGRILYRELPEVMRQYDNRDPETGQLGDLEAFLFGCGHMLDRFDATLIQLYADGFLDPAGPAGNLAQIQGWLLPYVAQLFGVELMAPDPDSRRRELARSIWIARRRGTQVAVDAAAETLTGLPAVVVPGALRVLRMADMRQGVMTQREIAGRWHPADRLILHEPLPPPAPGTHVTGFLATRAAAHEGLAAGRPDARRAMRAVRAGLERPDADLRPESGSGAAGDLVPFVTADRRGRPCFPASYEDRSLRSPDMRAPGPRRRLPLGQTQPDAVTLFLRPPSGIFTGAELPLTVPRILAGRLDDQDLPDGMTRAEVFHQTDTVLRVTPDQADAARHHIIEDLKFAGTLQVHPGSTLDLLHCAIRRLTGPASATSDSGPVLIRARNCVFDVIDLTSLPPAGCRIELEYCTITQQARLAFARATDCIFAGVLQVAGDDSGARSGCLRLSLLPPGFDAAFVHLTKCVTRLPLFLAWPCPANAAPGFGQPGYAVLSDRNPRAISAGAEDGGEMGIYHDEWHLARVDAAMRKAAAVLPAGQHVYARYDLRLLAPLPSPAPGG